MTEATVERVALLPCPFCGETEKLEPVSDGVTDWLVCRKCGCDGPVSRKVEQARRAWNTRARPNRRRSPRPSHPSYR